jgi:hypothetical protein
VINSLERGFQGCAGESGEVLRMQVSYGEGAANHTGPELCVASREAGDEALAGGRAGQVLSPGKRQ